MTRLAHMPNLATLLLLSCSLASFANAQAPAILAPTDHCRDFSADAIVTFADPDLEQRVRDALQMPAGSRLSSTWIACE